MMQDGPQLSAYLDDELSPAERAALESRLAQDAALREDLDALRQTIALVREMPIRPAPRDYTLTPAMVGQGRRPPAGRILTLAPALAALLLAVLGLGFFLSNMNGDDEAQTAALQDIVPTITQVQTQIAQAAPSPTQPAPPSPANLGSSPPAEAPPAIFESDNVEDDLPEALRSAPAPPAPPDAGAGNAIQAAPEVGIMSDDADGMSAPAADEAFDAEAFESEEDAADEAFEAEASAAPQPSFQAVLQGLRALLDQLLRFLF